MAAETVKITKRKEVRGFALYDWAKSGFETSITAGVFPSWFAILFLSANGLNIEIANLEWDADTVMTLAITFGALIIAILSPSLGIIADRKPIKKKMLRFLTNLGLISVSLIALAPYLPVSTKWSWALVFFVLATCANNLASVFYNSLIPHIGSEDEMNEISNFGFAVGYLGGCVLLIIHLIILMGSNYADWAFSLVMATTGIWWYGFAIFLFWWIPEPELENEMEDVGIIESSKIAFSEVWNTLKEYNNFRTLFLYIFAYFLFIDGINSVQTVGAIYAVVVLGLGTVDLIIVVLALNLFAAPMAMLFSRMADRGTTKGVLQLVLVIGTLVIFLGLTFAPLEPDTRDDYDIQFTSNEDGSYDVNVRSGIKEIAKDPGGDEQTWAKNYVEILPLEQDSTSPDDVLKWKISEEVDGEVITFVKKVTDTSSISDFIQQLEDSRFSIYVSGGVVGDTTMVGTGNPSSLGDEPLDQIAMTMRDLVWAPLGIAVGTQFLLLGLMFGSIQGASQGLARSLFGKMIPESRSAEFFGFFGFFGRVAAIIGPAMYTFFSLTISSRAGILSIGFLILGGLLLLYRVDVDDAIRVAEEYEAGLKNNKSESE